MLQFKPLPREKNVLAPAELFFRPQTHLSDLF